MVFRLLADVTVVVHLAFVVFVLFGGLLVYAGLGWRGCTSRQSLGARGLSSPAGLCPLTPLENWLRTQSGAAAYDSSFIEHYLLPVLYPASLSRELQWVLGSIVLVVNAVLYLVVLRRRRRGEREGNGS